MSADATWDEVRKDGGHDMKGFDFMARSAVLVGPAESRRLKICSLRTLIMALTGRFRRS